MQFWELHIWNTIQIECNFHHWSSMGFSLLHRSSVVDRIPIVNCSSRENPLSLHAIWPRSIEIRPWVIKLVVIQKALLSTSFSVPWSYASFQALQAMPFGTSTARRERMLDLCTVPAPQ